MKSPVTRLLKIVIYLLHKELQQMYYTDVLFTNVLLPINTKPKLITEPSSLLLLTSTETCKKRKKGSCTFLATFFQMHEDKSTRCQLNIKCQRPSIHKSHQVKENINSLGKTIFSLSTGSVLQQLRSQKCQKVAHIFTVHLKKEEGEGCCL